ncbi:hypothetical protein AB1207_20660 [Kineococcus endophyticus]|uniref:Uncharacterized protein n=1 Tax=Kineococcus endophyticus TaxID=1181883 RepID=A0ABV3PC00_9ACTN
MTHHRTMRFHVSSWEIGCCSPKPLVGQRLEGYRPLVVPASPGDGWDDLAEELDLDALPPEVRRPDGAHGVVRGFLLGEFHVTEQAPPPPVRGTVLRVRVTSLDRRLEGRGDTWPNGEPQICWYPVAGSLRYREVTTPDWEFSPHVPRGDAAVGDVAPGQEDGVLVDLLLDAAH